MRYRVGRCCGLGLSFGIGIMGYKLIQLYPDQLVYAI